MLLISLALNQSSTNFILLTLLVFKNLNDGGDSSSACGVDGQLALGWGSGILLLSSVEAVGISGAIAALVLNLVLLGTQNTGIVHTS